MMKKIGILFIIFLAVGVSKVNAQLAKANKYYANYEYANAIPYYLKVVNKGTNIIAIQNLANCYRLTKNYSQAEIYYAKAVQQAGIDPISFFYYGLVLKNNKKYEEAEIQFNRYMEMVPSDKKAGLSVKSMQELKLLMTQPSHFEVTNVAALNSLRSEFAPVFYKNGLVYTSDREVDLINFQNSEWNKQPYFNLYFAERDTKWDKSTFKSSQRFSKKVNSLYHDGIATFNSDQTQMFFTRIEARSSSNKIMEPHIYDSKLNNGKWDKAVLVPLAQDSVWVSHPSLSADGQQLFFAADIPGGFGGKDIYVSKREGDKWGEPKNLGATINTVLDEVFPYIRRDNVLFFSSTGHTGLGGFDIFSSTFKDGQWNKPENSGTPLNSSTDDFGILFAEDNITGYFSSDRAEGKGADDIYSFVQLKLITMKGKVLSSNDINQPVKGIKVLLLSEDGKVLAISSTDDLGFFKFENLSPDQQYLVKMDERDPNFRPDKKYYLANELNKIIRVTVINSRGQKFIFEKLPADLTSIKPTEMIDNMQTIAGTLLIGDNPSKPYAFKKVNILNEKGELLKTIITNAFGSFVFSGLDPDMTYFITADENDSGLSPNSKIILTNSSAKEVSFLRSDAKGRFRFTLLKGESKELSILKVEDDQLRMDLKGKLYADTTSRPLGNIKIELVNEKGEIQQSITTKENGAFLFTSLPFNESFLFRIDETDQRFKNLKKIIFTNESGSIVKIIYFNKDNGFRFQFLPGDYKSLSNAYVNDPWLKVLQFKESEKGKNDSVIIVENIYYNLNDYQVLPEAAKVLDKVVDLMKNNPKLLVEVGSHTDSRATDEYNMNLSQKRAKVAVNYIIQKGVVAKRMTGKGFGETKLINKCLNTIECTEEEHARNRRTEFRVYSR